VIISWPQGRRAAAAFTFDVDAESCVLAHDPAASSRMSLMTHQSYGPRVGVPRLLRLLARQQVTATFFVPGFTADTYPDTVRQIIDAGHEVAHHGYLHEPMQGLTAEAEAEYIDRGLEALDRLGVRPVGYRAPWWEMNWHSADLLIERGFLYDSSLLDGDVPYRFTGESGRGSLVEIPVDWTLDDWEQYAFYPGWTGSGVIESPAKVHEMWLLEALERLIEDVRALDGMWIASLGEIARHAADTVEEVRRIRRVECPEGYFDRTGRPVAPSGGH
jgi:peptidoglycan/xylan/chitin deacetylase (PgdA/CDA1 family)